MINSLNRYWWISAGLFAIIFWNAASDQFVVAAPPNPQRLEQASRLNDEVIRLYREGKYRDAFPSAKQALAIWEAELGPNDPETAWGLHNLGELHRALADFAAAKPLFERALSIRERVLGREHQDTATTVTLVAMVNESMGDYVTAEKSYKRALAIREKIFGLEHPEVASALNNLGNLMKTQGKNAEAEKSFLRGLKIREKTQGPLHLDNAPSLDNLASLYTSQAQYAEAEPLYLKALQIRETQLGKDHPDTAFTLNNLASLYKAQSRYAEARVSQQRCLEIREKLLGYDHPLTATSAGSLGAIQESQGDMDAAEKLYLRAIKSLEKSAGPNHFDTGIVVNNLASLYKQQNRYGEAVPLYQQALKISEAELGPDHPTTAQVLSNFGGLRELQGQFPVAEKLYRRSLDIRRKALGENHPDTAQSINNLALLLAANRNVAEAIPLLEESLTIRQKSLGDIHPTTVDAYVNLATYQEQQHDPKSIGNFDAARRGIRQHVVRELPALSEGERTLFLKQNYERGLHTALSCGLIHLDVLEIVEKSASWLLNGKAVGVEASAQKTLAKNANAKQVAPPEWVELAEMRNAIPPGAVFVDIARFNRFDFALEPGAATWLAPHYAAWITPASGAGDVKLIDLGPSDAIDDVVKQAREQLLKVSGDDSEIAATGEQVVVEKLNVALQALADKVWKPLTPHLGDAKEMLLSPDGDLWLLPWAALPVGQKDASGIATSLIESYSLRLVVSGRDLTRKDIVAASSIPVILANPEFDQPAGRKQQSILGIFKMIPLADEDSLRSFSVQKLKLNAKSLPNTEIEAISIQPQIELYSGQEVRLYKQQYALESVAKKLVGPKVAVFATHGFFLPQQTTDPNESFRQYSDSGATRSVVLDRDGKPMEDPLLRCGLLLSGCNQQGAAVGSDDGILTGAEVTGINLRGTDLVVLSACETGLGDVNQGEGVAGLRQAFQLAGAKSVVASLWKVSDRETSLLVSDFFRNLAAGQSKSTALQNAQLSRIEKRRERHGAAHPFYWAAFTLTGQ